jgi:hypothetical protein
MNNATPGCCSVYFITAVTTNLTISASFNFKRLHLQLFKMKGALVRLIDGKCLWYMMCKPYRAKIKVYEKNDHINDRLLYSSGIMGAIWHGND